MTTTEQIKNNEVYQKILADSFGGIMYDVDNRDKYEADEIVKLWNGMSASEKEVSGGIMKGALQFVAEVN